MDIKEFLSTLKDCLSGKDTTFETRNISLPKYIWDSLEHESYITGTEINEIIRNKILGIKL